MLIINITFSYFFFNTFFILLDNLLFYRSLKRTLIFFVSFKYVYILFYCDKIFVFLLETISCYILCKEVSELERGNLKILKDCTFGCDQNNTLNQVYFEILSRVFWCILKYVRIFN